MLKVKGALTGKQMSVPFDNIGLVMSCKKVDFIDEFYDEYPEAFTRIYLKETFDHIKFVDCAESVSEITTGCPEYSTKFYIGICLLLAAMLTFIIYG